MSCNCCEEPPSPSAPTVTKDVQCGVETSTFAGLPTATGGFLDDDGRAWQNYDGESGTNTGFSTQIDSDSIWSEFHTIYPTDTGTESFRRRYELVGGVCTLVASEDPSFGTGLPEAISSATLIDLVPVVWRVRHYPTATCYMKVWLEHVFTDDDTFAETVTDITAYEWSPAETPFCLLDPTKNWNQPENLIASAPVSFTPTSGGTNELRVKKYSFVSGYTPPDDGSANGYPPA